MRALLGPFNQRKGSDTMKTKLTITATLPIAYIQRKPAATDEEREEVRDLTAFAKHDRWSTAMPPLWTSMDPPPALGSTVEVRINQLGAAVVCGYFVEDGFLGILVAPKNPPAWYVKQNGDTPCHVFGAELLTGEERAKRNLDKPAAVRRVAADDTAILQAARDIAESYDLEMLEKSVERGEGAPIKDREILILIKANAILRRSR